LAASPSLKRKIFRRLAKRSGRRFLIGFQCSRNVGFKNKKFFSKNILQRGFVYPEIFRQYFGRQMRDGIAQQHRFRLGKVAVVENEQEFATVWIETLDRMRNSTREKPEIVLLYVGDKTLALRIDCRDPCRPVKHDGPLGGRVPMQLPHTASGESHVYARHGF
jgi:hypothetical protein